MIREGTKVEGINMNGIQIKGTVENMLNMFQVAIVKTGEDRTKTTEAYISELEEIE